MEKYEKIRVVGRGAYGTVFLCHRISDEKLVIMKQIPVEQMTKEERQASLNESKVLSMLDHPNIISYYENFLEEKSIVIVMEYAPGGTLYEYLQQRDALLSEEEILYYFAQIVLAIHHIHSRQILHRDMKSQNILLNERKDIIKIGDFGISKILSSKSKAYTVVGTPCYISPELCEGKPYNQKSDIWALGCVLYELLTLKRPFEATNLHALVVKIMKGTFDPVAEHYSSDLRQLLFNMLHLDPSKRPTTSEIMAQPFMISTVYRLFVDIGCIPCVNRPQRLPSSSSSSSSQLDTPVAKQPLSEEGSLCKTQQGVGAVSTLGYVLLWGHRYFPPFCLPLLSQTTEIISVAVGGIHKIGLIKGGRVMIWEEMTSHKDNAPCVESFIPRILDEKDAVAVTHVACGKDFTTMLTVNGILLTFGKGASGCLGHGNYHDVIHPKIITALLDVNIISFSCGSSHVVAVTEERDIFAWGEGTNGKLGMGKVESYNVPQKVPIPSNFKPKLSFCGHDCSFFLTSEGQLMACGSNRHNKLAMDTEDGHHTDEALSVTPVHSDPLSHLKVACVSSGSSHTVFLAENGDVYTVGSNQYGQLGWGNCNLTHSMPNKVDSIESGKITHIACGDSYSVAVIEGREIYTWGRYNRAQEVDDFSDSKPKQVPLPIKSKCTLVSLACNSDIAIAAFTGDRNSSR